MSVDNLSIDFFLSDQYMIKTYLFCDVPYCIIEGRCMGRNVRTPAYSKEPIKHCIYSVFTGHSYVCNRIN